MTFFQATGPADTFVYMALGYGVIFAVIGLYLFSLVRRWRNLKSDLEMLEQGEKKDKS